MGKDIIEEADNAYYNEGRPIMDDESYDSLRELFDKRASGKRFKIGASPDDDKIRLSVPMYSLDKAKNSGGVTADKILKDWIKSCGLDEYDEVVIMPKYDGISVEDTNTCLSTRGDGVYGIDISKNAKYVVGRKSDISCISFGELLLIKDIEGYSNRRNPIMGMMRAKIASEDIKYIHLVRFGTSILNEFNYKSEELDFINKRAVFPCSYTVWSISELSIENLDRLYEAYKSELIYEIDGLVIHINDNKKSLPLGRLASGNPQYAIAYKGNIEEKIATTVRDIVGQVSKNGEISPVLVVDPVNLDGSETNRLNAYNWNYIEKEKCGIGAVVIAKRSGKVTPRVDSVITTSTDFSVFADKCPACGGVLTRGSVNYICENNSCKGRGIARLSHFVTTMQIPELSYGMMQLLYEAGYTTIRSILEATHEELSSIDGIGDKKAIYISDGFANALKNVTLSKLIYSFGIMDGIGEDNIDAMLKNPDNVSIKSAYRTRYFDGIEDCLNAYEAIEKYCTIVETMAVSDELAGQLIVMTGFRSDDLKSKIISKGGFFTESMSSKVTLVIAKDVTSGSTKINKARKYGIEIISAEEAYKRFN